MNAAGRRLLGYDEEHEMAGTLLCDHYPDEVYESLVLDVYARVEVWSGDATMLTRDGKRVLTNHRLDVRRRPDARFESLLVIATPVSGR